VDTVDIKARKQKRVVWLYVGDHTKHPFISLAAKSLIRAGYVLSVVDSAAQRGNLSYNHIPLTTPLKFHHVPYGYYSIRYFLASLRHTLAKRPEIIIATLPISAAVGWLVAKLLGSRLVYYPFELYGEQDFPVPGIFKKVERQVLSRGINAIITQNEERARIYVQERRARVAPTIVHNYKPRQKVTRSGKLRSLLQLTPECKIVLYEGILYDGRCLDCLLRSVVYLPEETRLVLMGEKKTSWSVLELILDNPAIANKVLVAPWVPQADLLEYVADADAGIIIYDSHVRNSYYCEPGKLSDYVFAGVPIAASRFPTIEPIIRRYGIGETFASPEPVEIAQAINSVLSKPKDTWQPALERACQHLAWETQEAAFLKAVSGGPG
jgi:glycosyltransferase involved in cell wall biosynthesis